MHWVRTKRFDGTTQHELFDADQKLIAIARLRYLTLGRPPRWYWSRDGGYNWSPEFKSLKEIKAEAERMCQPKV